MKKLIGREKEKKILQNCYESDRAEFIIVSGRRRVGKTYLINSLYEDQFAFNYVGGHNLTQHQQLERFAQALKEYSKSKIGISLKNWTEAFDKLREYLLSLSDDSKQIIFFDEMPWIDTRKSDFVSALEYFWNSWGAQRDNLMFIASGSATSWLNDNILENQGGLHARITRHIFLEPFTLAETEKYLESRGVQWDRYQISQAYMTIGGVPFYLSLLNPTWSFAQNVDELFFATNAELRNEFDELYSALFTNADKYVSIVKALSEKRDGLTRSEISTITGLQGSTLTRYLSNLEKCSFIICYSQFGKNIKNSIYKLCDFYTLFYFRFVEKNNTKDKKWWSNNINTPTINSWQGMSFELLCLMHLDQIKQALGINGISTAASSWRNENAQIDLVIDRADRLINLCEMKFSVDLYEITNDYADKLRQRRSEFLSASKTKKGVVTTFVTTYGVKQGKHSSIAEVEVVMNDLFR